MFTFRCPPKRPILSPYLTSLIKPKADLSIRPSSGGDLAIFHCFFLSPAMASYQSGPSTTGGFVRPSSNTPKDDDEAAVVVVERMVAGLDKLRIPIVIAWIIIASVFLGVSGIYVMNNLSADQPVPAGSQSAKANAAYATNFNSQSQSAGLAIYYESTNPKEPVNFRDDPVYHKFDEAMCFLTSKNFAPELLPLFNLTWEPASRPVGYIFYSSYRATVEAMLPQGVADQYVAPDNRSTFVTVQFLPGPMGIDSKTYTARVETAIRALIQQFFLEGIIQGYVLSLDSFMEDIGESAARDLVSIFGIVTPIVFVFFSYSLGSVRIAILPLTAMLLSLFTTFGILNWISIGSVPRLHGLTPAVSAALTLSLVVDYSYRMLFRYLEDIRVDVVFARQLTKTDTLAEVASEEFVKRGIMVRVLAYTGRSVVASGFVIALMTFGMIFFPNNLLKSIGIGCLTGSLVSFLVCVTWIPGLLLLFPGFFSVAAVSHPWLCLDRYFSKMRRRGDAHTASKANALENMFLESDEEEEQFWTESTESTDSGGRKIQLNKKQQHPSRGADATDTRAVALASYPAMQQPLLSQADAGLRSAISQSALDLHNGSMVSEDAAPLTQFGPPPGFSAESKANRSQTQLPMPPLPQRADDGESPPLQDDATATSASSGAAAAAAATTRGSTAPSVYRDQVPIPVATEEGHPRVSVAPTVSESATSGSSRSHAAAATSGVIMPSAASASSLLLQTSAALVDPAPYLLPMNRQFRRTWPAMLMRMPCLQVASIVICLLTAGFPFIESIREFPSSNDITVFLPRNSRLLTGFHNLIAAFRPGEVFQYSLLVVFDDNVTMTKTSLFASPRWETAQWVTRSLINNVTGFTSKMLDSVIYDGVQFNGTDPDNGGYSNGTRMLQISKLSSKDPSLKGETGYLYVLIQMSMGTAPPKSKITTSFFSMIRPDFEITGTTGKVWYDSMLNVMHSIEAQSRDADRGFAPVNIYLKGYGADTFDTIRYAHSVQPTVISVLAAAVFFVVLLTFWSLGIPLRALAAVVLNGFVTFGITRLICVNGWLWWLPLPGLQAEGGGIAWLIPFASIILVAAVSLNGDLGFALRVLQVYSYDPQHARRAVAHGYADTWHDSSRSAIMTAVLFMALVFSDTPAMNQLGIYMVVGSLVQCFVIKVFFSLPAMMLLGKLNFAHPRIRCCGQVPIAAAVLPVEKAYAIKVARERASQVRLSKSSLALADSAGAGEGQPLMTRSSAAARRTSMTGRGAA